MFFQMLEGLHESEAKLLVNAKDKKLHQIYKGCSANVIREAFGWDENFNDSKTTCISTSAWKCFWSIKNLTKLGQAVIMFQMMRI